MAPAEVPQTLWKSVRPRSMRTSRTPDVNTPRMPPPSSTRSTPVRGAPTEFCSAFSALPLPKMPSAMAPPPLAAVRAFAADVFAYTRLPYITRPRFSAGGGGRALHRVRCSAHEAHEKAGRRASAYRQATTWWRRGGSNSGPEQSPGRCLQAQSPIKSRTRHTP